MIQSKVTVTNKQQLLKLIQASKVSAYSVLEPVENEREVLDLLRKIKGKSVTIIIGATP